MEENEKLKLSEEFAETFVRLNKTMMESPHSEKVKRNEFGLLMLISSRITPEVKGVKASELSTILDITPAAVTHMINSLEEKGFVDRLADKRDRRVVLVRPTPAGIDALETMKKHYLEGLIEMIDFLGEKDSKELLRILGLLTIFEAKKKGDDRV